MIVVLLQLLGILPITSGYRAPKEPSLWARTARPDGWRDSHTDYGEVEA